MNKGKFITIDGVEGAGKSTQIDLICGYLHRKGVEVVRTREPGGTDIGEKIRSVLLDVCLLYTSPSPRDQRGSRMPSSA